MQSYRSTDTHRTRKFPHLEGLNPAQREVATHVDGPLLVLAGAGSGKTKAIVHRILHLIAIGTDPGRILAVTFTNRAAQEMRERVVAAAGRDARRATLCTFHSLGARILRDHADRMGLPRRFAIYSTGDQITLLRRILSEEVSIVPTAGDEAFDVKRLLARVSGWKNRLVDPEAARLEVVGASMRGNRSDDYDILAADLYPRYEEALRAAGACDFDDLLLLPLRLLRTDPDVREAVWKRWHHVMVDEYQDTNVAQLELARLLAGPRKNLCVVGDDDQSIYAWRGADSRNILEFEKHFDGARVVVLEENYRSTRRILEAANSVIANNVARRAKWMRTANGPGPKIDYWEFGPSNGRDPEANEAAMVAREIGVRRFHERLRWSDFAVLYRANHQSRPIEEALREANVPYRVLGGTSYFDRKEIADAAAYLRVLAHPRDDLALRRIINFPSRGIGRTTQLRLIEAARERNRPLIDVLREAGSIEGLGPAQREAIAAFGAVLERARSSLVEEEARIAAGRAESGSLRTWADRFLREISLAEALRAEAGNPRAAEARIENLRDFVDSIGRYESRVWSESPLPDEETEEWAPPSLAGFLQNISLVTEEDSRDDPDEEADQVTLLTLHSAKGLEFSHVFLVGLEEELLPHARSIHEIADGSAADPVAEERRLFYVGITRARHRLTLSGCTARRRGSELLPRQPSRFVAEIPRELLEIRTSGAESSLDDSDRKELRQNFFAQMRDMLGG